MKELTIYIEEEDYDRIILALSRRQHDMVEPSEEMAARSIMDFIASVTIRSDEMDYVETFEPSLPGALVPVDWVQPVTKGYRKGAVVKHNDDIWISSVENNVWEPGVSGWHHWGEEPDDGPFSWIQPSGSHDAYQLGDRVVHNGSTWESVEDGNVWEPGVYGWVVV